MMTCLVLSLAHLLLKPLAVREIARPLSAFVRVTHTLAFSCDGEGQGRWRSRDGDWGTASFQCPDIGWSEAVTMCQTSRVRQVWKSSRAR
jgi:hypothetical protein